jgi:hypothetical protein
MEKEKEEKEKEEEEKPSLEEACWVFLGGVSACSPEIYRMKLERIAEVTGRIVDDEFRNEVLNVLKGFPCPLD